MRKTKKRKLQYVRRNELAHVKSHGFNRDIDGSVINGMHACNSLMSKQKLTTRMRSLMKKMKTCRASHSSPKHILTTFSTFHRALRMMIDDIGNWIAKGNWQPAWMLRNKLLRLRSVTVEIGLLQWIQSLYLKGSYFPALMILQFGRFAASQVRKER